MSARGFSGLCAQGASDGIFKPVNQPIIMPVRPISGGGDEELALAQGHAQEQAQNQIQMQVQTSPSLQDPLLGTSRKHQGEGDAVQTPLTEAAERPSPAPLGHNQNYFSSTTGAHSSELSIQ